MHGTRICQVLNTLSTGKGNLIVKNDFKTSFKFRKIII